MNLQPVGKLIYVEIEEMQQPEGIIIMPNQVQEMIYAHVLARGEKVDIPIKVGDKIMMRHHAGQKVPNTDNKIPQRLINEVDVLGIVSA